MLLPICKWIEWNDAARRPPQFPRSSRICWGVVYAAGLCMITAIQRIFRAPPLSRKVFRAAMTCSTWEATVVQQPPTASAPAFM